MLVTADVKKNRRLPVDEQYSHLSGIEKHKIPRSTIPAVTHVDGSARVQTVHKETNPRYWALIHRFNQLTGCPVLINTSFNVRGEPIVCSPKDAYHCFMRTHMDYMVMENILLAKTEQPLKKTDNHWKLEFTPD